MHYFHSIPVFQSPDFRSFQNLGSQTDTSILYAVSVAHATLAAGHRLLFDQRSLEQLQALGNRPGLGVKTRFTHPNWTQDGLGRYLGRMRNFHLQGGKLLADLHLAEAAAGSPEGDLRQYVLNLAREDPQAFGVSVVVSLDRYWITGNGEEIPFAQGRPADARYEHPVARITQFHAANLVDDPALNPNGIFSANPQGETQIMEPEPTCKLDPQEETVEHTPAVEITQLKSEIANLKSEIANLKAPGAAPQAPVIQAGGTPPRGGHISLGQTGLEIFQNAWDWIFGAPQAHLPPPALRRSDELYRVITGDLSYQGVFRPEYAFASATSVTLADMAVNAMNKVIIDLYQALEPYRWYEMIVSVQPTDGSLHDMQWIQFGGIATLPTVAEGAAYTELSVSDTKESDAFTKYGGYVGITDKLVRNSEIARLQAIPRALTIAAVRTRSAKIAAIFTVNSGTGPTLDQDSTVLFHANHGGNVQTTAYSIAAWRAARVECAKMTELGSGSRTMLWPKFWLGPADLYDTALVDFGYGAGPGGYSGTPNNDVNPYAQSRPGDPRPIPIAVPEWTDTNDWAYITDPVLNPVICMAYANSPAGSRNHPAPELFTVTSPTAGLLFTNDTLPIKVRDYFAYGVATWRGIGKRNVT